MCRLTTSRTVRGAVVTLAVGVAAWMMWMGGCGRSAPDDTSLSEVDPPGAPRPAATEAVAETRGEGEAAEATAGDLLGVNIGVWDYRVLEGERDGQVVRVVLEEAPDDADLPLRRRRADGRVEHLGFSEDGSVVLGAIEDPDEGVRTSYNPPLVLIPAELTEGEAQEYTSRMTVVNLEPPHRRRGSGTATRTVRYVGDETIESPAGDFRAKRIEASFRGEMTLATVTIDATEWYSPEVGLVQEKVDERVRAAVLFGSSDQQTIRIEALPEETAAGE